MTDKLSLLDEILPEGSLLLEPREEFDRCVLGWAERFHDVFAVYSRTCVLEVIAAGIDDEEDDEKYETAIEHYNFNVVGGWVGDATPAFLTLLDEDG